MILLVEERTLKNGKFGAGILVVAKSTGRILLAKRGSNITYPDQWTNFGGGANDGEKPIDTAIREFREESGYGGELLKLKKCFVNKNKRNKYWFHNYIGLVSKEFIPNTVGKVTVDGDIEVADYRWVSLDELKSFSKLDLGKLHYGISDLLHKDPLQKFIKNNCI